MAETKTADGATEDTATEAKTQDKPQRKRITRRKAVEQRARSYFEAMDRRDAEGMLAHWSDEGVEDVIPVGVMRGREELRSFFNSLFRAMPDARTTVTRVVAGEQSCAVEWRMEGTFSGEPYLGIDANGKHVEIRGCDLLEFEDGQITSLTAYSDGAGFARQIGLLPPDGSGADRAMKSAFNAATKVKRALAERRSG
jgi:steroid delta-isomerase-like uncharacterized protein